MDANNALVGQLLGELFLGQLLNCVAGGYAFGLIQPRVLNHRDLRPVDQLLHVEQLRCLLRAAHLDDQMAVLVSVRSRDGTHLFLDRLRDHERVVRQFALAVCRCHKQHGHRTMLPLGV